MAAFADVGAKILVGLLLAFDLILNKVGFGKSMFPKHVYTREGVTTDTQLAYFILILNVQLLTVKLSESYLSRSHARLGPLLQSALDENRLTDSEWKEEYFHLLDNKHWNLTLSTPEYWSEYFMYSVAVSSSVMHNVLLAYLHRAKT